VRLFSRNGIEVTARYPTIHKLCAPSQSPVSSTASWWRLMRRGVKHDEESRRFVAGNRRTRATHHKLAASVIVPRDRLLRDALISHRRLKHHTAAELIEHGALDFLPRRLAWRIMIAAILFQRRGTLGQFRRRRRGAPACRQGHHAARGRPPRHPRRHNHRRDRRLRRAAGAADVAAPLEPVGEETWGPDCASSLRPWAARAAARSCPRPRGASRIHRGAWTGAFASRRRI
jgi:hypothetical protein